VSVAFGVREHGGSAHGQRREHGGGERARICEARAQHDPRLGVDAVLVDDGCGRIERTAVGDVAVGAANERIRRADRARRHPRVLAPQLLFPVGRLGTVRRPAEGGEVCPGRRFRRRFVCDGDEDHAIALFDPRHGIEPDRSAEPSGA